MHKSLEGIIQKDGYNVLGDNGKTYCLPVRGTDKDGYPEVLIDGKPIGMQEWMARQSVQPYIGMRVSFTGYSGTNEGSNYEIIPPEDKND